VKSLFVVDVRAFPGATEKSPTLAIQAPAWRAADHLVGELKERDL
jgi:choline dehydrogenase-like flavoprotein